MDPLTRRGGRPTRTADRTPGGDAAQHFLTPWSAREVAAWLGCGERTLRRLREDPASRFPAPMAGPRLQWWPADVLAWSGVPLREAITAAATVDEATDTAAVEAAATTAREAAATASAELAAPPRHEVADQLATEDGDTSTRSVLEGIADAVLDEVGP